ncbi:MAG: hypothetical protein SAJ37_22055 [Oscillatoria sp. PMC 1068.18]|nr:hypothetical protein [Oscillatoria sp. PMC 1068.18]
MVFPGLNQRLQDLADNIAEDQELLNDYEKALSDEDEPRRKRKYRREIERQRESVTYYQLEYAELKQKLGDESSAKMQQLGQQLQQIETKVDLLLSGQVAIYENVHQMRQALLNRYDATEQVIIGAIAEQLDETQLVLTQRLLDAVEANQLSQSQMQQMLTALEARASSLPPAQATALDVIKDPELDAKHRLTVTLPIVPLLVNYEGEVELGTGFNLQSAWETLVNKVRRR